MRVELLRNTLVLACFFFALLLLYFSDGFVIYCNALRNENILLNVRMIHTIYRTQCTPFEINAKISMQKLNEQTTQTLFEPYYVKSNSNSCPLALY